MNTNRGRKRRTEHERDSIREFNALVREHSEDALQNILRLSKYADDENIRLKASTWIAEKLPEPPTLLSLNELAIKTGLSYQFLRKMIVEEKHVPYIKVGNKYIVNYELFLHKLGNMEG